MCKHLAGWVSVAAPLPVDVGDAALALGRAGQGGRGLVGGEVGQLLDRTIRRPKRFPIHDRWPEADECARDNLFEGPSLSEAQLVSDL